MVSKFKFWVFTFLCCLPIFFSVNPTSCNQLLEERGYRKEENLEISINPPVLLSMPGSGSLYARLLLELSSGLYSGSLGTPTGESTSDVLKNFKFESSCGLRLGFIWSMDPSLVHVNPQGTIGFNHKPVRKKCRRGVLTTVNSAIILVRNPFHAMLSSFLASTNVSDFRNASVAAAWKVHVDKSSRMFAEFWDEIISKVLVSLAGKVFIMRYEDLFSGSDASLKFEILEYASEFILRQPCISSCEHKGQLLSANTLPTFNCSRNKVERLSTMQCAFQASSSVDSRLIAELDNHRISSFYDHFYSGLQLDELFFTTVVQRLANFTTAFEYQLGIRSITAAGARTTNSNIQRAESSQAQALQVTSKSVRTAACHFKFGHRLFYSAGITSPALLLSFPGSGNTWSRLLLEYSTGVISGSVDVGDKSLRAEFIGETTCLHTQLIIKAHPDSLNYTTKEALVRLADPSQAKKCKAGQIDGFGRVLLLVRDPYASILAEFQRSSTHSHIGRLSRQNFPQEHWERAALDGAKRLGGYWAQLEPLLSRLLSSSRDSVHVLRYEDMRGSNSESAILNASQFLLDPSSSYSTIVDVGARVQCALLLSESNKVRRVHSSQDVDVPFAYANAELVSTMWTHLLSFARKFGYSPLNVPAVK